MNIFLFDFDEPVKEGSYHKYLSNGEGIVERQLRMIQSLGESQIKIAGNRELFQYCEETAKKRRDFSKLVFEYVGKEIKADMFADSTQTYLLLAYNLLYAEEDLRLFVECPSRYAVAALPRQEEGYQGLTVRIDMDWIVELGTHLQGLDTCPVLPMIKFTGELLEEEDILPAALTFSCKSAQSFLAGILNSLSDAVKGVLCFTDQQGVRLAGDQKEDYELSEYMQKNDFKKRRVISGQGSIVYLSKIIKENKSEHVLLVCDDRISQTPVEALFEMQEITCKKFQIAAGMEEQQALKELKRTLKEDGIDLIIAAGDRKVQSISQQARRELEENIQTEYPGIKLAAVPSDYYNWAKEQADYWVMDSNMAGVAYEETDKTKIHMLIFRLLCSFLNGTLTEEDREAARELMPNLSGVKNRFLSGSNKGLELALQYNHQVDYFSVFYDNGLEHIPEIIGQAIGVKQEDVAAAAIPFLTANIFAALPVEREPGSDLDKFERMLSRNTTIHYQMDFDEELAVYSQKLVNQGIWFGSEEYPAKKDQIMKEIKKTVDIKQLDFLDMASIEKVVEGILSYDNRDLVPEVKKAEPQTEEEAERLAAQLALEAEQRRKEQLKNMPLKKRIFLSVKKYKIFRELNNFRKKCRYKLYQFIYPVQTKWIVFESYGGTNNYGCNTRAIYEAMLGDPDYFDYKFIWAFNNTKKFEYLKENPNTVIVKRGTKRYVKFCARSKYIFTNTGMPKYIKPNKEQKMVYTWHGKPLKRIGCSFKGESEGKRTKKQLIKDYTASGKRLTILTSPSPVFTPIMADAYNLSPQKRKTAMLETGYPRNDYLFKYTPEDVLRLKINLGIPFDKKVVLYAPTWRPFKWIGGKSFEHVAVLDLEKLHKELGDEYVFLCRLHHLERDSMHFDQFPGFVYDVSMVQDVNELYIISDLLVSDYSGTIFDFANLCRPIVFFMYDKEEYVGGANGLNFELDFLPGPIVETQEELTEAIKYQLEHFVYDEKYKRFNEACNCLDGADCSYRTAHQIVEVNPQASRKQERQVKYKIFGRNTKLTLRGYLQKLPFIKNDNTRRIESFHNKYKGQRCFLIGNGPSLRLADLNMLKDEICFGCNMIYKVFERTDWRPTFLCASDRVVAQAAAEQLQSHPESTLWVSRTAYDLMKYKGDNLIYVSNLRKEKYYVHGDMTEYYVPSIATVMTFMIELAMYMGFSEIYLLGVDFTIGRGTNDHFMNSYRDKEMTTLEKKKMRNLFKGEDIGVHEAQIRFEGRALYAYEQLEKYARKHGYHVYNATRGGMLEVFERADLDKVVGKK